MGGELDKGRRDFLRVAGILAGSAVVAACVPEVSKIDPLSLPKTATDPFLPPTLLPDYSEIATAIPTPTPEQRFRIGSYDAGSMPVTIVMPSELKKALGYSDLTPDQFRIDRPMKVDLPYLNPTIQEVFARGGTDTSRGNPSMVYLTDKANLLAQYVHSTLVAAPGETARIIGRFLIKNPEKESEIIGKEMEIIPDGGEPMKATIVAVKTITEEAFQDTSPENSFWGLDPAGDNILLIRSSAMGLPDSVTNDNTPGVYYMTIIACQPKDGELQVSNDFGADSYHNTRNRTLLTLKIVTGN